MISNELTWQFGATSLTCDHPIIMGIVNVTPDSFSDGGKFIDKSAAVEHALRLIEEGADILDIGGESTRPGSEPVSADEEIRRTVPVIRALRESDTCNLISIDTRKLAVAEKAVEAGADIVNDVSAFRDDPELADFVAQKNLGVVLMHMLGTPKTMQASPEYADVIADIGSFFEDRLAFAHLHGVKHEQIVLDPGIGFGKTLQHNLTILGDCGSWLNLKRPILIGASRKRFIGEILNLDVDKRLNGTIGACVAAYMGGARIFRVHDVGPVKEALTVAHKIMTGGDGINR